MRQAYKQVPYGVSDFITVVTQNLYYVDSISLSWKKRPAFSSSPVRAALGRASSSICFVLITTAQRKKISKPFSEISGLASIPLRCKVLFRSSILISRRWVEALMSLKKDSMNIVASV